jgi:hypothetical protein
VIKQYSVQLKKLDRRVHSFETKFPDSRKKQPMNFPLPLIPVNDGKPAQLQRARNKSLEQF